MKRLDFLPISGKFEITKVEEYSQIDGQISIPFDKKHIVFEKNNIEFKSIEITEIEDGIIEIRDVLLEEETDQRKVHVLYGTNDEMLLLVIAGTMHLSEIDKPLLMLFNDLKMTTGILLSLNRIH